MAAVERGHSTKEALTLLLTELEVLLSINRTSKDRSWLRTGLHPGSPHSLFRLTTAAFCLLLALSLMLHGGVGHVLSGAVLALAALLNVTVSAWESYQRSHEILKRSQRVLLELKETTMMASWQPENYPHLHTPMSASVVLQWTLRDGQVVNLPWALLVKDDVVLMKPGQTAPAKCSLISNDINLILEKGDTFHIDSFKRVEKSLLPEFKTPVSPQKFVLLETPFRTEFDYILKNACNRPVSKLEKMRYYIQVSVLEHLAFPIVFVLALAWNCIRYLYNWTWVPSTAAELFFSDPVCASLPLLPLLLPAWWVSINYCALSAVFQLLTESSHLQANQADPFDDTVETPDIEEAVPDVDWKEIFNRFDQILRGTGEYLARTENLLHTLGSVTSFCCTDKKGILSWPNTSAEKIFFLKSSDEHLEQQQQQETLEAAEHWEGFKPAEAVNTEILTVTHDLNNPFRIEFDDPHWHAYLPSLKPLGLSILLNTCNIDTEEKYTNFYNYLLCESAHEPPPTEAANNSGPDLLPIPTRGCLCELSTCIGLSRNLSGNFQLEQQLQTFRPVISESPGHDTFAKNLALAKLKFPFPHMVSLVARDTRDHKFQLVTQGTADIVLDSCSDVWTGSDLRPLNEELRKRILEFYHRASLTSYCSAFSYRPLSYPLPWSKEDAYLELPPNSLSFLRQCSSEHNSIVDRVSIGSFTDDRPASPSKPDYQDVLNCLESQCNQSFVGMVQMQYQARVDMVQFIDLLEKACIRFVHFSKENELRSRVFSEKMGLESGWNCHISLRTETNLRKNARDRLYSRRWVTKKFSTEREQEKQQLSSSLPEQLNSDPRFVDFPKWSEVRLTDSAAGSTSSILQSVHYDMSNRAQLPTGINNIRPHLETMDNVPLLVSLFTDCTPATSREMVEIMQENGEVVVLMGSAANYHNIKIFIQSNASLAVEPLYPQVCQHVPVYLPPAKARSPVDLARLLTSVACSTSFRREEDLSLYYVVMCARRHSLAIAHSLQTWMAGVASLSLLCCCCLLLALPAPLSPGHLLVFCSFHLPLLVTSSFLSEHDANIRAMSTGKNGKVTLDQNLACYIAWCFGLRFLPSVFAIVFAFFLSVMSYTSYCEEVKTDGEMACLPETDVGTVRDVNLLFLTVYFSFIFLSFAQRTEQLWQIRLNRSWPLLLTAFVLTGVQLAYLAVSMLVSGREVVVPTVSWVVYVLGLLPIVVINEIVKRQDIKVNVRFQKRARLEFGTKLGINSPF